VVGFLEWALEGQLHRDPEVSHPSHLAQCLPFLSRAKMFEPLDLVGGDDDIVGSLVVQKSATKFANSKFGYELPAPKFLMANEVGSTR